MSKKIMILILLLSLTGCGSGLYGGLNSGGVGDPNGYRIHLNDAVGMIVGPNAIVRADKYGNISITGSGKNDIFKRK